MWYHFHSSFIVCQLCYWTYTHHFPNYGIMHEKRLIKYYTLTSSTSVPLWRQRHVPLNKSGCATCPRLFFKKFIKKNWLNEKHVAFLIATLSFNRVKCLLHPTTTTIHHSFATGDQIISRLTSCNKTNIKPICVNFNGFLNWKSLSDTRVQGPAEKHPLLLPQWKPLFGFSLRWVLNYKPCGSLFLPSKLELGKVWRWVFERELLSWISLPVMVELFHGFDLG